ncbi:unnamed protein product, partial [Meganyctiphanes norvegica]
MSVIKYSTVVIKNCLMTEHRDEASILRTVSSSLSRTVTMGRMKEAYNKVAPLVRKLFAMSTQIVTSLENNLAEVSVSGENESAQQSDNLEDDNEVISDTVSTKKISKAEKRRQKKAQENREREERIKEAEKNNKYCARNLEAAKIKKILKERNLKMHEIQPDGNCLYAAIAHQLENSANVASLRSVASKFLLSNRDDFAPFITDPNTGEMLTPEAYDEYCSQVEHTPAWGGQPELRALSQALKRKIEVLQAEGTNIVFGEEFPNDKSILLTYYRLYYGLGEHYNSVMALTVDEDQD